MEYKNIIFVIGTGRSGTHFLGRLIGENPSCNLLLEDKEIFPLCKEVNISEYGNKRKLKRLLNKYKKIIKKNKKKYIIEKSHQNIWIVEELQKEFPNAFFIGIERDVKQVVYSMMRHPGILKWFNLLDTTKESHFLGINKGNIHLYDSLTLEEKCAIRWVAHKKRMEYLKHKINNLIVVDYNKICNDYHQEITKLEKLMNINLREYAELPNFESLHKFKQLTEEQIKNIEQIVFSELKNNKYHVQSVY